MKLKPLREQVVVVMGASSGIGRETALRLAKRGAKMVVAARSEAGLRSKLVADPDGLFTPMKGQDRVEGEFGEQAVPSSHLTWLDTHPSLKWSIGVVGAAIALSALRAKSGERR
jgi:NAD(P)-dependent dehydrogenase (short-subunit alcohol dehydrogenase family)